MASVSTLRIPWCVSLCAETSARSTEICVFICVDVAGVEPRLKLDCLTWKFGAGVEGLGPGLNMLTVPRVRSVANRSGTAFRTGRGESHSTSRDELLRSFSASAERVAKYETTPSPSAPTAPFPSVVVPSCVAAPNPSAPNPMVRDEGGDGPHNANRTDRTNKNVFETFNARAQTTRVEPTHVSLT